MSGEEIKPGYKRTEVGVIPEDWGIRTIGCEVDRLEAGVSVNSVDETRQVFPHEQSILKTSAVANGEFFAHEAKKIDPKDVHRARLNPKADSLIVSRMNTPDLVGECGYVANDYSNLFLPDRLWMTRLKPGSNMCVRWLAFLLSTEDYKRRLKGAATGTSGSMKNLSKDAFLSLSIPFPSAAEQRTIATALSDVEALLAKLDQLIAKKRDLKQATMQQLLTGQIRLPGFSGEWEEKALSDIAFIAKGTQLHNSETDCYGHIPHYNGGIEPSAFTSKSNTPANTIVISEGGNSCGYVQWISMPFWCGGHCYAVTPKMISKDFLFHALKGQQNGIMSLRVGSGLPNIQKKSITLFKLRIPKEPKEQIGIAMVLSDIDAELAALEVSRGKMRDIKQGMMQDLLIGRIRLV